MDLTNIAEMALANTAKKIKEREWYNLRPILGCAN